MIYLFSNIRFEYEKFKQRIDLKEKDIVVLLNTAFPLAIPEILNHKNKYWFRRKISKEYSSDETVQYWGDEVNTEKFLNTYKFSAGCPNHSDYYEYYHYPPIGGKYPSTGYVVYNVLTKKPNFFGETQNLTLVNFLGETDNSTFKWPGHNWDFEQHFFIHAENTKINLVTDDCVFGVMG